MTTRRAGNARVRRGESHFSEPLGCGASPTLDNSFAVDSVPGAWLILALSRLAGGLYAAGWLSGFTCEYMAHDLRMGYARYFAALMAAIAALAKGKTVLHVSHQADMRRQGIFDGTV